MADLRGAVALLVRVEVVADGVGAMTFVAARLDVDEPLTDPMFVTRRRLPLHLQRTRLGYILAHAAVCRLQIRQLLGRVQTIVKLLKGGCLLQNCCLLRTWAFYLRLGVLV